METVKSADGTVIAYDRAGDGPALIVSVGAFRTRHTFVPPDDLKQRFSVVTYDRRGRGDSGDTEPFAAEREYEDLEPLTPTLPYDLAVTGDGLPAAELGKIAAPVLIIGGGNSPAWFRRSVAEQAAAIPGASLGTLDGYDHNAPVEVITPILVDFFGGHA